MKCQFCPKPARPNRVLCQRCANRNRRRQRKLYQAREARGLCPGCGQAPARPGLKQCGPCAGRVVRAVQRWRNQRKARGLCASCGKKPLANANYCRGCADRANKSRLAPARCCADCPTKLKRGSQARRCPACVTVRTRQMSQALRAERTAAGICVHCGKAPARSGNKRCGPCADKALDVTRQHSQRIREAEQG